MSATVVPLRDEDKPVLPPCNIEAEMALLGGLLVADGVHYPRVVEAGLKPEHFYDPVHERIFTAIGRMAAEGKPPNPTTLRHVFEHDPEFAAYGGVQYLARLARAAVTTINLPHYARTIFELHLRRGMLGLSIDIDAAARDVYGEDHKGDVFQQAADLSAKLDEIACAAPLTRRPAPIGKAMAAGLSNMEAVIKAEGRVVGVPTGIRELDKLLGGLRPGDDIVLAGATGIGKTGLALTIARNAAALNAPGAEVAPAVLYFSLEMPAAQMGARLIAAETGISVERQRAGPLTTADIEKAVHATRLVQQLPLTFEDNFVAAVSQVRRRCAEVQRRQGLALIAVDYVQLMVGEAGVRHRVEELSQITRDLKRLAVDLGVPVIVVSQLSRALESREDKRPLLSDLRESGSIEQDADTVIFVYRDAYYWQRKKPRREAGADQAGFDIRFREWLHGMRERENKAELIVAKNRHGPVRTLEVGFSGPRVWFHDLPDDTAGQQELI